MEICTITIYFEKVCSQLNYASNQAYSLGIMKGGADYGNRYIITGYWVKVRGNWVKIGSGDLDIIVNGLQLKINEHNFFMNARLQTIFQCEIKCIV